MATALIDEIKNNFNAFDDQWPKDLATANAALAASPHFPESYVRITSIQAWRAAVVVPKLDENSAAFFFEAQNDFLVSHCMAQCGSFRQALKALRAAIENIYFALFYKDHPVELLKWELGQHKLGFTELTSYFESHPSVQGKAAVTAAIGAIKAEYGTLSKAVHGSAKAFRMTQNLEDIKLWSSDLPAVGKWATREKAVIVAVNHLLLAVFKDDVAGTKQLGLRQIVGAVIPKTQHAQIKTELGVTLPA